MPPYLFPLPTTTLLTFSSLLTDPSGSYTTVLSEATAARTRLQLALKSVAENEAGSSALAVLDAVQVYLPYLKGIIACLDADELLFRGEPNFPWTSPLTQYTLSPPLLYLPSIHCEHLFILLTYTLALSNYSYSILNSLPYFELKPGITKNNLHITNEDEKKITSGLSRSVDLLCQASGLSDYISENICLKIEPIKQASGGRLGNKGKWPVEGNRETFKGLSMMFLADAHLTAIRKLLLPVLSHTLFSPPGPPLPSNHPSSSLLSKLYLHVTSLYTSSRALLKANQSSSHESSSSKKLFSKDKSNFLDIESSEGEIILTLKRYLKKESQLSMGLSYKWLGIDCGENSKNQKIGESISWLRDSLGRLEEMENSKMKEKMKGLSIGKNTEKKKNERKDRKSRIQNEIDDVKAWLSTYIKMNDTVTFQPIPTITSLVVPSGRPIFGPKAFIPPLSKFEPNHRLPNPGEEDDEGELEGKRDGDAGGDYAGKGNYF